jgi:hypothetical protein
MKRRYKKGDWLRVPLGGGYDALGIIARMCRSRLFGYFFAVPSSQRPTHDELLARKPQDALVALLFGAAPLEDARWELIATSLRFDEQAWPLPLFASRGAFGDTWTQIRYDANTLQIVERRRVDAQTAEPLSDARFAGAEELENVLRAKIAGRTTLGRESILEVRSPIDPDALRAIEYGGRLQFSTPLHAADLDVLAAFIDARPDVALRVHGFRHGFDAQQLTRYTSLRELLLDVRVLQHAGALGELHSLRGLRIGGSRVDLQFLRFLTALRKLELQRTRGALEAVSKLPALQMLVLESTAPIEFAALRSAASLQTVVLAHGDYNVDAIAAFKQLRHLELRTLDTHVLPPLSGLEKLEELRLHALAQIDDLRPIAGAPALQRLFVTAMPHLNVRDFAFLQQCAGLRHVTVEIGSRTKEREIYRLMKGGNT